MRNHRVFSSSYTIQENPQCSVSLMRRQGIQARQRCNLLEQGTGQGEVYP